MIANKSILMLPGDGIGPEVMAQAKRVLGWLQDTKRASFTITEDLVGGAAVDVHGVPITDATMAKALSVDAVFFGAVGGPQYDKLSFDIRPEAALLRLRKELGVFANLRPAKVFDALVDSSSLKPELVRGLDIMIVRECIGGVYFGEPRGIETLPDGSKRGVNTEVYTTMEIERVGRVAFELARKRNNIVCSVEKANVMESGLLWRQTMQALRDAEYPDVTLSHMYADNCAMQLAKNPKQFDVIVTGNLFGDILSDLAAMLTGSLGMLPSATLGAVDASGRRHAFYEPIHGSAPDIAGKGLANPLAQILSLALMLRYSFDMDEDAAAIEAAVERLLATGGRTADIPAEGRARLSTAEMGDALLAELAKAA
ncbi:MAG: 3-isopropylmalate dehydrogenase [Acidocella sp. 20-57-95]|nr:MAG: 3-isopropylmalate dehydrogenase [Acidocella sp. 20-57-95]OYV62252.1 MAG: 3-isopropylmalate dehydrogenase [Acidocella sp. 21-58-7]HQT62962.1 3-isopropylmalate dehydrogenase [Acidocella sp.]HQU04638.1 3-isopropylmalate dehydrogenase [Acidocella sp.]